MTIQSLTENVKKTDSLASASSLSILQAAPGLTRKYFTSVRHRSDTIRKSQWPDHLSNPVGLVDCQRHESSHIVAIPRPADQPSRSRASDASA